MNLSDAFTFVLKTRGQKILQDLLREDLPATLAALVSGGVKFFGEGRQGVKKFRLSTLQRDVLSPARETVEVLRVFPRRLKLGLTEFQADFLAELQQMSDTKEKTLFSLKVLGALTSSSTATMYNVRSSGRSLSPAGPRIKSAFAQFLVGELVLRLTRLFTLRFIDELEREVTIQEDLETLAYFRRIMGGGEEKEAARILPEDPSFRIVEKLKKVILSGDDEP